jgi:hypothetical protein
VSQDESSLEDRVARLERQLERQIDDTILLTDTVFNLIALMGKPLEEDEEYQHIRRMATLIREQRQKH